MLSAIPMYSYDVESTPPDVQSYLSMNGWQMFPGPKCTYYKHPSAASGYMTWEQAIAYQIFKKLTLGAL